MPSRKDKQTTIADISTKAFLNEINSDPTIRKLIKMKPPKVIVYSNLND
jgi:hypothetical protein